MKMSFTPAASAFFLAGSSSSPCSHCRRLKAHQQVLLVWTMSSRCAVMPCSSLSAFPAAQPDTGLQPLHSEIQMDC